MISRLLLILLLFGFAPVLPSQAVSLATFCNELYARVSPKEIARREQINKLDAQILDLKSRYEAAAKAEPMGGGKVAGSLRQTLEEAWNRRAQDGKGYSVTPLEARFAGEQNGYKWQKLGVRSTRHLNANQRAQFEIHVDKGGNLRRADGSLLNTCVRKKAAVGYDCKMAIFVMDGDGKIYVYEGEEELADGTLVHHSTFLAGLPAASAGQIQAIDGRVIYLDAQSGHYLPKPRFFRQLEEELTKRGANLAGARILPRIAPPEASLGAH